MRKLGRRERKKQLRINHGLRKKMFGDFIIYPCCYCMKVYLVDDLTIEHKTPLCLGGTNDPSNIDLACPKCNHDLGKEAWKLRREENRVKYGH